MQWYRLGYGRAGYTLDHLNDNPKDVLALLAANEDFDQLCSFIHRVTFFLQEQEFVLNDIIQKWEATFT